MKTLRSHAIGAALLAAAPIHPAAAQDNAPAREEVAQAAASFEQQAEQTAEMADRISSAPISETVEILRQAELNGVDTAWYARMRISDAPLGPGSLDAATAAERTEVVQLLRKQSESLGQFAETLDKVASDPGITGEQAVAALERIEAPQSALIARGLPGAADPDAASGEPPQTPSSALYMIGPGSGTTNDYPSVAAVYTHPSNPRVSCTGTLVSPRVVVTAAHCFEGEDGGPPVAVFFQHAGRFAVVDHSVRDGWGFVPGPLPGTVQPVNDLAVLQLDRPVTTIRPAEILAPGTFRPGARGTIVGFGWRNPLSADGSPIMGANLVPFAGIKMAGTVETRLCDGIVGLVVTDRRICWEYKGAQAGSATVCKGDSGGPLFTQYGGRWYLAGVTSFGLGATDINPCPANSIAIDSDLTAHRDWVMQQIARFDPGSATLVETALQPVVNDRRRMLVGRYERLPAFPATTSLEVKNAADVLSVGVNGTQRDDRVRLALINPDGTVVCELDDLPPMVHCVQGQPATGRWQVRIVGVAQQEVQVTALLF